MVVLYVGDWDKPAGDIEDSAYRRLARFAPGWGGSWERLAVTDQQANGLRQLWITKRDGRDRKLYETLEADALGPVELRPILENALAAMLPVSLSAIETEEERQRRDITRRLR
jgi:hypothetical protein